MSPIAVLLLAALASVNGQTIKSGSNTCSCSDQCTVSGRATYNVRLEFLWPLSDYRRPTNNPHWSRSVFSTHSGCAVLFRNQVQPSNGMASLTTKGEPTQLENETKTYPDNSISSYTITAPVPNNATANRSGEVVADRYRSALSVMSMIAPSPSWFVGVDSVPLCSGDQWVQSVVYDIAPWNSGADNGVTYSAPDAPANPFNVTYRIRNSTGFDVFQLHGDDSTAMARVYIDLKSVDAAGAATSPTPACNKCSSTCSAQSYDWTVNKPVSRTLAASSPASTVVFSSLLLSVGALVALLA